MLESGEKDRRITGNGNLMAPWKPGQSGNPTGRPKGRVLTSAMEKLIADGLDGKDLSQALAKKAVAMALGGNFQFFNLLMDRLDGKVAEQLQADVHHTITLLHTEAELPRE